MNRFKIRLALAGIAALSIASNVCAWDEYGPVAKGKTEVDLMATYAISPEAGSFTPSLQVKYGIIDGLDVELLAYTPTDPEFGLAKPNIAIKYAHASGFGGFVGFDIPVASEKIDADPQAGIQIAAQYNKTFDKLVLNDWLMYNRSFADGAEGSIDLFVKPQYNVTDKIGPYLGLQYVTSESFEGYTFTFKPGVNVILTDVFSVEAQVPVAKTKDVDDLGVGAYVGFYGLF